MDELGGGTVLELDRGRVLVACDDGRELWVDRLEIIPESVYHDIPVSTSEEDIQPVEPNWSIGAHVGYLNEPGGGTIVGEGDQGFLVLDEDGFERWFIKSHLVLMNADVMKGMQESATSSKDKTIRSYNPRPKQKQSNILEVDLHIHELLEFDSHLSSHEKLQYQLRVARHQVEKAKNGHYKKVILIHGVGKGVLKQNLLEMLHGIDKIRFHDASMEKYGSGATEVELL